MWGLYLQAQQGCLDEERRTRTKLAKRLERVETARRQETKQLRDELECLRQAAAEAEAGHREAVQQRDVQLVVAESKAAAQRSQLEQQEQEVRRMQEQVATRERELATVHDERLNLELKQQQLRYDRRLQVCRCEPHLPLHELLHTFCLAWTAQQISLICPDMY